MPEPVSGERKEARFPEKIGRYDILLPVASGGMGTVYLGRISGAHGFEREVAVKLMHAHLREAEGFALDLVEEGKLAVRIRHPNVVSVLDVGEDSLGLYLVMDYVEGDSLWGLLRGAQEKKEQIPIPIGMRILADALSGLHAAHEVKDSKGKSVGLVHRDFSPHNILVGVDGIGRLTDFGVAKAATRIGTTGTGIVKGKMAYMSPEQARGEDVDRRTDVWAAGVIAWEIVAGKRLFPGGNDASTLLKIVSTPPPRLSEVVPGIATAIDDAIMKALTHDLAERWQTASAFRQALLVACANVRLTSETEDVGEYVTRIVGARLAQRRDRIHEVVKVRDALELIEEVEPTHTPSRSTSRPAVKAAPVEQLDATLVAPSTPSLHPSDSAASLPLSTFAANEVTEREPRGLPLRWIAIGGVGVLVAVGIFVALHFAQMPGGSTVAAQPLPMSSKVEAPPAPSPTESAIAMPVPSATAIAVSAASVSRPPSSAIVRTPAHTAAVGTPAGTTSGTKPPPLAPMPYGH